VAGAGLVCVVVVAGAAAVVVVVVGPGVLAMVGLVAAVTWLEPLDALPQATADRPATISSAEASECRIALSFVNLTWRSCRLSGASIR
jgi:hypothetical protein